MLEIYLQENCTFCLTDLNVIHSLYLAESITVLDITFSLKPYTASIQSTVWFLGILNMEFSSRFMLSLTWW